LEFEGLDIHKFDKPHISNYNFTYNIKLRKAKMAQVTIYLDKETEEKMRMHTKSKAISQSQWIANLIRERLRTEWPEEVIALAGSWRDFPLVEELRTEMGKDAKREQI
jgi:hypothetical protein